MVGGIVPLLTSQGDPMRSCVGGPSSLGGAGYGAVDFSFRPNARAPPAQSTFAPGPGELRERGTANSVTAPSRTRSGCCSSAPRSVILDDPGTMNCC
jgi:hypothetical protein